jgi:hypothetical protein
MFFCLGARLLVFRFKLFIIFCLVDRNMKRDRRDRRVFRHKRGPLVRNDDMSDRVVVGIGNFGVIKHAIRD